MKPSLRYTLAAMMAATVPAMSSAAAPVAEQVQVVQVIRDYDIPAGPLQDALNRFGRDSGITLTFTSDITQGLRSQALHGRHTINDGLALLLAGSGLHAEPLPRGYLIRRQPDTAPSPHLAQALPAIHVDAVTDDDRDAAQGRVLSMATRLALTARETPQAVSSVSRDQLDERQARSIEDLAALTTGLVLTQNSYERGTLYARGFPITWFLQDGMLSSADSDSLGLNTLAMVERVEILRGAAGLATGVGDPSGVVNLVRKRPTATPQVSLAVSAARWNDRRVELDAAGPLNEAGTLRGRAVVAQEDANTFVDHYRHHRTLLYATVDADLTRDTRLSLGLSFNREDNPGSSWYGLPTAADGTLGTLPRSANSSPSWAGWTKRNIRAFAELETRLDDGWRIKLAAQAIQDLSIAVLTSTAGVAGSDTSFALSSANRYDYRREQAGLELQANGPLHLLGGTQEVVVGASYRLRDTHDLGANVPGYYSVFDIASWHGEAAEPTTYTPSYSNNTRLAQAATFGTVRWKMGPSLSVISGMRLDWYDYRGNSTSENTATSSGYSGRGKFTPYVGLSYDLDDTYTAYANWTRIFKPQANVDPLGRVLPPVAGTSNELGIKAALLGGALDASASVFLSRQSNLARSLGGSGCYTDAACYVAAGEVESRGFELQASGNLSPDWQLNAGYAFTSARYVTDSGAGARAGERYNPDLQPMRMLHASSTWRLPQAWSAWRVGATMRVQSGTYGTDSPSVRQGGYTLLDLMASWQATPQWQWRLAITNLLDKRYYQTVYNNVSGNTYGEPRNVSVTAKYSF